MDLTYSAQDLALKESVGRFCEKSYSFLARKKVLDTPDGFSRKTWRAFADLGWIGAGLPEDVGGAGGSAVAVTVIAEVFGRALVVEPYISCAVLCGQLLNTACSGEQRLQLLQS